MLSFNNQQGATGADFVAPNDNSHQWSASQANWDDLSEFLDCKKKFESHTQQSTVQFTNSNVQANQWSRQSVSQYVSQYPHHQQYNCNGSSTNQVVYNQMQIRRVPVHYPPSFYPAPNQYLQSQMERIYKTLPQNHSSMGRPPLARINFVPNSVGGFKAVVKRKRKRTMFTTEQIEAMESVFQRKPYVTRNDRQVLVQQLQLSDTSIKVWFQNRRLRGKRAAEEAAEEAAEQALYEETNTTEQSFYSTDSTNHDSTTSSSSSPNLSRLDSIEHELIQNADESGYITLDDKSMAEIFEAINSVLPSDVNLELKGTTSLGGSLVNLPSYASNQIEDVVESEGSNYSGSIYEDISPAVSPKSDDVNDETRSRQLQFVTDQNLKNLFDLHFC